MLVEKEAAEQLKAKMQKRTANNIEKANEGRYECLGFLNERAERPIDM